MRRWALIAATIAAALLLGACGSSSDRPQQMALAALKFPGQPSSNLATPPGPRCTASLRPPGTMPAPGAMPAGSFMARIQHRGYLLAGVDQNTLLLAYANPLNHNHLEGLEIDLLRQVAKAIFGNPDAIRFVAVTTAERTTFVDSGVVDIVADAFTMVCDRWRDVDFSTVYLNASQKLLVPNTSPIHSIRDLAGRRVCATISSTTLGKIEQDAPNAVPYPVPQRTDCLVALQEGWVDAISSDDAILLGFKAQDPYTKIVGPSIEPEPYGMAINKAHRDFVRFVNGVLEEMRTDGTLRTIYSKWLGKPVPPLPAPRYDG